MDEFTRGALTAVSLLLATHDQPVIAADVLRALGMADADCSDLDDYDKEKLRKVQGEAEIFLRGLDETSGEEAN